MSKISDLPSKPEHGEADYSWNTEEYYRARLRMACELLMNRDGLTAEFCKNKIEFIELMRREGLY
jgi:hypothetical protein